MRVHAREAGAVTHATRAPRTAARCRPTAGEATRRRGEAMRKVAMMRAASPAVPATAVAVAAIVGSPQKLPRQKQQRKLKEKNMGMAHLTIPLSPVILTRSLIQKRIAIASLAAQKKKALTPRAEVAKAVGAYQKAPYRPSLCLVLAKLACTAQCQTLM